jgi:hypothetical protein
MRRDMLNVVADITSKDKMSLKLTDEFYAYKR